MIERQNQHLVAGVRELYQRLQNNDGWIGPQLGNLDEGRPATHQILEALGIQSRDDIGNDAEGYEDTPCISELQSPVDVPMGFLASSSPLGQGTDVPRPPLAFAHSTVISHRLHKSQHSVAMLPPTYLPSVAKTGVFTDDGSRFPPLMPAVKANMDLTFGSHCGPSADMVIQNIPLSHSLPSSAAPWA